MTLPVSELLPPSFPLPQPQRLRLLPLLLRNRSRRCPPPRPLHRRRLAAAMLLPVEVPSLEAPREEHLQLEERLLQEERHLQEAFLLLVELVSKTRNHCFLDLDSKPIISRLVSMNRASIG